MIIKNCNSKNYPLQSKILNCELKKIYTGAFFRVIFKAVIAYVKKHVITWTSEVWLFVIYFCCSNVSQMLAHYSPQKCLCTEFQYPHCINNTVIFNTIRIRGATVARLTPDQKVACSNHVEFKKQFCWEMREKFNTIQ